MEMSAGRLPGEILAAIRERLKDLPQIQQQIARFILDSPQEVVRMSISHLAMKTGAKSEASIVKFYRSLGFTGYHDFKVTLATEIAGHSFHNPDDYTQISVEDDISAIRKKIFVSSMRVLESNNNSIDDAVLAKTIDMLEAATRVIILGYGTSGVAAYDLFVKLSRLGIDCHYSLDAHINALVLAEPREGDVIFAISYSGESRDVVLQAERVRGMAKLIALTGEADSPLAEIADVCITVRSFETAYRTDAMISRMVQITIIDILFTALAIRGGDTAMARLSRSRQGLSFLKF
jgi:DNA-binding MurR/RpiR family transcriptional regulator